VSRYEFIGSQKSEPDNRNPVIKMWRWLSHDFRTRFGTVTLEPFYGVDTFGAELLRRLWTAIPRA
jgi:hypothetical protein